MLFETHTESTIFFYEHHVKDLIDKHRDIVKLATIDNDGNVIADITPKNSTIFNLFKSHGNRYIVYTKLNDNCYKLAENSHGKTSIVGKAELQKLIKNNKVINCQKIKQNGKKTFGLYDTEEIEEDSEFKEQIDTLYKRFILKTKALGLDNSFEYVVEGHEVKITNYTGNSRSMVLPNFITTIVNYAFSGSRVREIKLNDNLKYIGKYAFNNKQISYVEVPETVELMFKTSFGESLTKDGGKSIQMLGNKTIVL